MSESVATPYEMNTSRY